MAKSLEQASHDSWADKVLNTKLINLWHWLVLVLGKEIFRDQLKIQNK